MQLRDWLGMLSALWHMDPFPFSFGREVTFPLRFQDLHLSRRVERGPGECEQESNPMTTEVTCGEGRVEKEWNGGSGSSVLSIGMKGNQAVENNFEGRHRCGE